MRSLAIAGLLLAMAASGAAAQVNAGEQKSDPNLPFTVTQIATLSLPWKDYGRRPEEPGALPEHASSLP